MKLRELLADLPVKKSTVNPETEISSLVYDSRKATPGSLFIAVSGLKTDGHRYIDDAVSRGAVAVMAEEEKFVKANPRKVGSQVSLIFVENTGNMLLPLGKRFYNDPASSLRLIGVVGTNGKTTSTFLIRSILEAAGYKTGLIGTIYNIVGDRIVPTQNTTPGPLDLQKIFSDMVKNDVEYVVMEVSSHAIALGRVEGLTFYGGVFTNITQDHLDFHRTFEEYFRVKSSFFKKLPAKSHAVINIDDPKGREVLKMTRAQTLTFGLTQKAQIRAEQIRKGMNKTEFRLVTPQGETGICLNLIGDFNVHNALGAVGIGLAVGLDLDVLRKGVEKVTAVPGRFQTVPGGEGFTVVVDYAHSPDGLENVLKTARTLAKNRIITVFGCGGDRDRGKRPIMGEIAAKMSDFTIVTNDNPRSEEPGKIARDIEAGFKGVTEYKIILDRKEAIREAIFMAKPGDIVIIAGKGHEDYQIFADRTVHFDDREEALAALKERKNAGF